MNITIFTGRITIWGFKSHILPKKRNAVNSWGVHSPPVLLSVKRLVPWLCGWCRSLPLPSLGPSDYTCVYLMAQYRAAFRQLPRVEKSVKCWSESISTLFKPVLTVWTDECGNDVNDLCDSIVPSTNVIDPNNKSWVTNLSQLLTRRKWWTVLVTHCRQRLV